MKKILRVCGCDDETQIVVDTSSAGWELLEQICRVVNNQNGFCKPTMYIQDLNEYCSYLKDLEVCEHPV